jgi:hypothetical protein
MGRYNDFEGPSLCPVCGYVGAFTVQAVAGSLDWSRFSHGDAIFTSGDASRKSPIGPSPDIDRFRSFRAAALGTCPRCATSLAGFVYVRGGRFDKVDFAELPPDSEFWEYVE